MTDYSMKDAIRDAWASTAPTAAWRGVDTGINALDAWELGVVIHKLMPAAIVVAGGLGAGGLPLYLADMLDVNHRGKLIAAEPMSPERRRSLPDHRRVQWQTQDGWLSGAWSSLLGANPVLVVGPDAPSAWDAVTIGSYMVVPRGAIGPIPPEFVPDLSRDPLGMSAMHWLLRVPT